MPSYGTGAFYARWVGGPVRNAGFLPMLLLAVALTLVMGPGPAMSGEPGNDDDWYGKSIEKVRKKDDSASKKRTLDAQYRPLAEASLAAVRGLEWPSGQEAWPQVKKTITEADDLLHKVLVARLTETPDGPYGRLRSEVEEVKDRLAKTLGDSMTAFQGNGPFFDAYPVPVGNVEIKAALPKLRQQLAKLPRERLAEIEARFGPALPKDFGTAMAHAYFKATLRTLVGSENDASLQVVLRAAATSKQKGMPVHRVAEPRVLIVDLTGHRGAGEFAVSFEEDLPFELVTGDYDDAIAKAKSRDAEIVIVLSIAERHVERSVGDYSVEESRYQSGTRTVPNPSYAAAEVAARHAVINYQKRALNSSLQNAQYCSGLGCLGKLIGQIGAAAAESKARSSLEAAAARLRSTPITIEQPVYSAYTFQTVPITSAKHARIRFDIIDRRSKQHSHGHYDARKSNAVIVAYGLKKKDESYDSYRSTTAEESDIVDFEKGPLKIGGGEVLAAYRSGRAETKAFKGFKALRKTLAKLPKTSKRSVAAKVKRPAPAVAAVPATQDARFKSSVVVLTPGGRGSGFYVERDLVMTNHHVVGDTKFVEIVRYDGSETFGKVVALDRRLDLALIRVQATGTPAKFFDRGVIPLGEPVYAVGHPSGLNFTLTRGIVSAVRNLETNQAPAGPAVKFVQTDTPINPGNSGGPLFLGKKVIGVNVIKLTSVSIEGISFAVHHAEAEDFLARNRTAQ